MTLLQRYAHLLSTYCIAAKPGQRVLVKSTFCAEPLLKELYRCLLEKGCLVSFDCSFSDQDTLLFQYGSDAQLTTCDPFYEKAVHEFDALIRIIAPHNTKALSAVDSAKKQTHQAALAPLRKRYMERSANKELQWTLCVYPTHAAAQEAGMSLLDYEDFVYKACMLDQDDPIAAWQALSQKQQGLVDYLNTCSDMVYIGDRTELSFSVKNRTWINSDGHYNMPSGEVFSGPVEDSVSGQIYFSYPTVYEGSDVSGVELTVENGVVQSWKADVGQAVLDRVFAIEGARVFGEVAIGTNYAITTPTKNILFDEKIGGSVHMAIGASYPETGGTNESAVHWDMIKDMRQGGKIIADGRCIYENGLFLIP